jgi:four helix bundle protein
VVLKSYKDLEIYKLSYDLAIKIHKMSLKLPQYEMYEEGSQIRRSSKAVTSCIVEGYGRKRYKADFIKFLIYAHASCDETILHLNFIKDTHKDNKKEIKSFLESYDELGSKINRFIQYVEKQWNTQRETRNSKLVTRNAKPVTRNS